MTWQWVSVSFTEMYVVLVFAPYRCWLFEEEEKGYGHVTGDTVLSSVTSRLVHGAVAPGDSISQ